jgi:AmmeMemoRadiSam system protein A
MKFENKELLAKTVVISIICQGQIPKVQEQEVAEELRRRGACFVTLYVDEKLHGCIGSIEAKQPLYKDIIENAVGAAVRDYRFPSLREEELKRLTVEVSVLTPLKTYTPESSDSLLSYLRLNKPGLVIEKQGRRAVYLPQVWEQLPDEEQFLRQLCLKAGLEPEAWRDKMRFQIFDVEK